MDPKIDNESGSTYHVLPKVLLPFDSARRKNCAALNCEGRVSDITALPHQPNLRIYRYCCPNNEAEENMGNGLAGSCKPPA